MAYKAAKENNKKWDVSLNLSVFQRFRRGSGDQGCHQPASYCRGWGRERGGRF